MSIDPERNISAEAALQRLKDGNRRFVAHRPEQRHQSAAQLERLAQAQWPFAIILGCSDSRVPAELVFDQGLGDLFVIRVAGNIVAPSQIGSVEFAAASFGTALAVVLGHSSCGAIQATVDSLYNEPSRYAEVASAIVSRVMPAVEPLVTEGGDEATLLDRATRANVSRSVEELRAGSPILSELCDQGRLAIVGAHYQLDTGEVDFLP